MLEVKRALQLSALVHFIVVVFVIIAGIVIGTGVIYWTGAAIFIVLLIFQHAIVKPTDLSRVNLSFFTTNGIASLVYAVFVIASLYI
jgi:4-hydroxybenzoate polyprenyltransferase